MHLTSNEDINLSTSSNSSYSGLGILTLAALVQVLFATAVWSTPVSQPQPCRCHPHDNPSDCSALCSLWLSTSMHTRSDLGPWGAGGSVCTWGFQHGDEYTGAACAGSGRVTSLVLENLVPPLLGHLPPALGNLTALKKLSLWQNQMHGRLPPSLGQLTQLESLNLNNNEFDGGLPPQLGQSKTPLCNQEYARGH